MTRGRDSDAADVALLGCGYWGRNLLRNLAQLGALRWVCDANPVLLREQGGRYPEVQLTECVDDVLADDGVRGVAIATPAATHYAHAKAALLCGKDVFVEKPLALRYEEGRELVELAEARGAILMVGHILEYHPAVALLRDLVRQGELGPIWYLYSNRLNLGKVRQEENILWSFAPHDISVITSLIGATPVSVNASGGSYLQSGIADVTVSNLQFESGARAHIFVSWLHPYKEQRLVVVGERKMAVFDDMAREGKLKIYDKGIEWRNGQPVPRQTAETMLFYEETEPLRIECEHFLTCIRERERPLTDGENGLRVLKVLAACQLSLERGGRPVALREIEPELVP